MNENVRKSFKENPITHSGAHYLMTIHEMQERKGYARASDVAKALEISLPSCTQSLKSLTKKWLTAENEDGFYILTQEWYQQVLLIEKNKEITLEFFTDILWVTFDQADKDSCKIEHLLSPEVSVKLCRFIKALKGKEISLSTLMESYVSEKKVCMTKWDEECVHCE